MTAPTYSPEQVREATRLATEELRALTDDEEVIQTWLVPRVRAKLLELAS